MHTCMISFNHMRRAHAVLTSTASYFDYYDSTRLIRCCRSREAGQSSASELLMTSF